MTPSQSPKGRVAANLFVVTTTTVKTLNSITTAAARPPAAQVMMVASIKSIPRHHLRTNSNKVRPRSDTMCRCFLFVIRLFLMSFQSKLHVHILKSIVALSLRHKGHFGRQNIVRHKMGFQVFGGKMCDRGQPAKLSSLSLQRLSGDRSSAGIFKHLVVVAEGSQPRNPIVS